MTETPQGSPGRDRLASEGMHASTFRRLLAINPVDPRSTLDEATVALGEALSADASVFLCDAATRSLVLRAAHGTTAPKRAARGFDRLPLTLGGVIVTTYLTGNGTVSGDVRRERGARLDVARALDIVSAVICRLQVGDEGVGVLTATSARRDWFSTQDLQLLEAIAPWVTLVARTTTACGIGRERVRRRYVAAKAQLEQLTPREREVSALVASGLTNEDIAGRLMIVPGTVANHVEHILSKLGFSSRVQIATWSVLSGLREPEIGADG